MCLSLLVQLLLLLLLSLLTAAPNNILSLPEFPASEEGEELEKGKQWKR